MRPSCHSRTSRPACEFAHRQRAARFRRSAGSRLHHSRRRDLRLRGKAAGLRVQKNPGRKEPAMKKAAALKAGKASAAYHQRLRPAGKAAIHTLMVAAKHMRGAERIAPTMTHVAACSSVPGASKRKGTIMTSTREVPAPKRSRRVRTIAAMRRGRTIQSSCAAPKSTRKTAGPAPCFQKPSTSGP